MKRKRDPVFAANPKRRAVMYLTPDVYRRVRYEHVERDIPMSQVVDEILAHHYQNRPMSRNGASP